MDSFLDEPMPLEPDLDLTPRLGHAVYRQIAPRLVSLGMLKRIDQLAFSVWCTLATQVRDLKRTGVESILINELEKWREELLIPKEIQDAVINDEL